MLGKNEVLLVGARLISMSLYRGFEAAVLSQPSRLSSQRRARLAP
jgi:hypothetical protein